MSDHECSALDDVSCRLGHLYDQLGRGSLDAQSLAVMRDEIADIAREVDRVSRFAERAISATLADDVERRRSHLRIV